MKKIVMIVLLLALLSACGGGPGEPAPAGATPADNAPQPVDTAEPASAGEALPEPAQEPTPEPTPEPTAAPLRGPGEVDLTEPASGLEALPAYQAVLKLAFSGTQDGQPYQAAKTYTLTVQSEPAARLLVVEATDADGQISRRLFANLAGVAYRQDAVDGPCQASLSDGDGTGLLFDPARLLPHLLGAEQIGEETLDEIAAQVLQFDARALGAGGEAEGKAWIAKDGGYILRYSLRLTAGEEVFGPGMQGEQTWEYTLGQPGADALKLPDTCPQEDLDLPALPDAQGPVRLPGYLRYTTSQDAAGVSAFYTEQLAAAGWQAAGDPIETGGGTRWLYLRAVDDGEQTALLTIRPSDAGLEVTLAVLPDQPASP